MICWTTGQELRDELQQLAGSCPEMMLRSRVLPCHTRCCPDAGAVAAGTRRSTSSLAAGRSVELVLISVTKLESQMWSSCANLRSFRIPLNLRDFAHDIMTLLIFLRLAQDVVSIKGNGAPKNKVFMLFGGRPSLLGGCRPGMNRWFIDVYWLLSYSKSCNFIALGGAT